MGELIQRDFVQPYPQQALGGELGLTSHDISRSLDIPHDRVLRKLSKAKCKDLWEEHGWHFTVVKAPPISEKSETTKVSYRPPTPYFYVLNVKASKAFIAKYENAVGVGYLNYLFDCEAQAERLIPRLKAALEAFMAPKHRRTPKGIRVTVQRPVIRFGLFGPICEIESETKLVSQLSPDELELYKNIHAARTMEGLTKAQRQRAENPRLYLLPKPEDKQ